MNEYKPLLRNAYPYVLADGRRFTTLSCAAHSVLACLTNNESAKLLPIVNENTGCSYELADCKQEGMKLDARSRW